MNSYCPECRRTYDRGVGVCPHDDTDLVPTEERDDPLIGSVFEDRYRLDEMLGSGGMGVVYRANQLAVDRDVAVKILRSEVSHSNEAHQRFSREAKAISSLSHPNIVQLIDFGRDPGEDAWFLVMEHVGGRELGDLLDGGHLDFEVALEVVYQTCAALSASHASNMVHRDLKPENLRLLTVPDGTLQVKVLDFGIARCVEKTTRLTESDMICGTPGYMAPEQARGLDVDPTADLYSLGVILFEMLSGVRPFEGGDAIRLLVKHLTHDPPSVADHLPDDSPVEELDDLVSDLMAKEPADRPADAAAVRDRIESIREKIDQPLHQLPGHYATDDDLDDLVRPVDRGATDEEFAYAPEGARNPLATTAGTFQALDPDTDDFGLEQTEKYEPAPTESVTPASDAEARVAALEETEKHEMAETRRGDTGEVDDRRRQMGPKERQRNRRPRTDDSSPDSPPSTADRTRPTDNRSDESSRFLTQTVVSLIVGISMLALAIAWLQSRQFGGDSGPAATADDPPSGEAAAPASAGAAAAETATDAGNRDTDGAESKDLEVETTPRQPSVATEDPDEGGSGDSEPEPVEPASGGAEARTGEREAKNAEDEPGRADDRDETPRAAASAENRTETTGKPSDSSAETGAEASGDDSAPGSEPADKPERRASTGSDDDGSSREDGADDGEEPPDSTEATAQSDSTGAAAGEPSSESESDEGTDSLEKMLESGSLREEN